MALGVCEVWQSAYGHRANKATWLYYFGPDAPPNLDWSRPVGTHQIGFHDQRGKDRNKPTLGRREASATPTAFRDLLISIARSARKAEAAMEDRAKVNYRAMIDYALYDGPKTIDLSPSAPCHRL